MSGSALAPGGPAADAGAALGRAFDSLVSRFLRDIGAVRREPSAPGPSDAAILARVEPDLAKARELKRWWQSIGDRKNLRQSFELEKAYNRPEFAYGFFDEAPLTAGPMPVMGAVQDMFYDQPKAPPENISSVDDWSRAQLRQFVFRYFLRIADFRDPETYARALPALSAQPPGAAQSALSWCPQDRIVRQGFGFSQHFYKLRSNGEIGKFAGAEQNAIIDLRELFTKYEWIVAKVKVYDFAIRFRIFENAPELVLNLDEESYLVIAADFIEDAERPEPGVSGEYGIGYAYLRNPEPGFLAYGPGEFQGAFKLIRWRTMDDGRIFVRMNFVANRPTGVLNLRVDPIAATWRLADLFSFGLSSRILGGKTPRSSATPPGFDPVYAYISLLNGLTGGRAEVDWCVSRRQLEMQFLVQHFEQHYKSLAASLTTWRLIADWFDDARLPEWVITGQSS